MDFSDYLNSAVNISSSLISLVFIQLLSDDGFHVIEMNYHSTLRVTTKDYGHVFLWNSGPLAL